MIDCRVLKLGPLSELPSDTLPDFDKFAIYVDSPFYPDSRIAHKWKTDKNVLFRNIYSYSFFNSKLVGNEEHQVSIKLLEKIQKIWFPLQIWILVEHWELQRSISWVKNISLRSNPFKIIVKKYDNLEWNTSFLLFQLAKKVKAKFEILKKN